MIVLYLLLVAGGILSFGGIMCGIECVFCKMMSAFKWSCFVLLLGWTIILLSGRVIDGEWLGGSAAFGFIATIVGSFMGIGFGKASLGRIRSNR